MSDARINNDEFIAGWTHDTPIGKVWVSYSGCAHATDRIGSSQCGLLIATPELSDIEIEKAGLTGQVRPASDDANILHGHIPLNGNSPKDAHKAGLQGRLWEVGHRAGVESLRETVESLRQQVESLKKKVKAGAELHGPMEVES